MSVVLAGGGTAGHVEPAMAVADALVSLDPDVRITALGTARGLETRLVPERGYQLELITPVPLPRKPTGDLARLPARVLRAVRQARAVLDKVDADVVTAAFGFWPADIVREAWDAGREVMTPAEALPKYAEACRDWGRARADAWRCGWRVRRDCRWISGNRDWSCRRQRSGAGRRFGRRDV